MKKWGLLVLSGVCLLSLGGCALTERNNAFEQTSQIAEGDKTKDDSNVVMDLIDRVNQKVRMVGSVELKESESNAQLLRHLLVKAYPHFTLIESRQGNDELSCGVTFANQICEDKTKNQTAENVYMLSVSHEIPNQPFDAQKSLLTWRLSHNLPVAALGLDTKKRVFNTTCAYEVKNGEYRLEAQADYGASGGVLAAMNYLFLHCPTDEELKKQLLTLHYSQLPLEEQVQIEQYLYVTKIFLNAERVA